MQSAAMPVVVAAGSRPAAVRWHPGRCPGGEDRHHFYCEWLPTEIPIPPPVAAQSKLQFQQPKGRVTIRCWKPPSQHRLPKDRLKFSPPLDNSTFCVNTPSCPHRQMDDRGPNPLPLPLPLACRARRLTFLSFATPRQVCLPV